MLLELGAVEAELRGRDAVARLSEASDIATDPALRAAATLALAGALVIADGHREAIQRLETTLSDIAGSSRELDLQLGAATHAYAKLGITARRQLPDALATGVEADAA